MVSTANGWVLRATGSASDMVADQGEVRRALALFADPDLGCELMALTSGVSRNLPGADLRRRAAGVPAEFQTGERT